MLVTEEKKNLRRLIKHQKLLLSEAEIVKQSSCIFARIEGMDIFRDATVVMAYWSMGDEVRTHDFIMKWYRKKTILLPVIEEGHLKACIFSGISSLRQEKTLGIFEPSGNMYESTGLIDLIIVPGVAFDADNNRLGRGKAYYDKFLSMSNSYKIGVCFDLQMVTKVPVSDKDIRMDIVVTCQ